jgi:hypothetical protein
LLSDGRLVALTERCYKAGIMTEPRPSEASRLTRRELHNLVWSTPVRTLAASFGISDVWLAKMCRKNGIPTPRPGYWAKKRAGKRVQKRGLPKSVEPDEVVVTWEPAAAANKPGQVPTPNYDADVVAALENATSLAPIAIPEDLAKPHRLVSRTRRILRARERGRNRPFVDRRHDGTEREFTPFDLAVSTEVRNRALKVIDALVRGFEDAGYKIRMTEGDGAARVLVLGEEYSILVRERFRQRPYDPKVDGEDRIFPPKIVQEPSGNLTLTLECETVHGVHRSWKDSKTRTIESVVDGVRRTAIRLVQRARETREQGRMAAERRAEEDRLHREHEEQRRRETERLRAEQKRVELLLGKVAGWVQAKQLRQFAAACRDAAGQRPDGSDLGNAEWLLWIDEVARGLDPLTFGLDASVKSSTEPSKLTIQER